MNAESDVAVQPSAMVISERLFSLAAREGSRELIIDPVFGRVTYGEAAEQVERLAYGLRAHGIGSGDIVIVQLPNWAPFLLFHIALSAIGAVTVTIPIVYRERELSGVIALTGARALVVPTIFNGFDYAAMGVLLRESQPSLQHVITVDPDEGAAESALAYHLLMREKWESRGDQPSLESIKPAVGDTTALGFTSGTTGALKGAIYDTNVIHATNMGFIERYGLNAGDRIFGCSPIGHAVGFTHALRMTLTIGGSVVLLQRWDPAIALELIEREHCTFMACATPFLVDLVYHPELEARGRLESVRLFLCGGASIPERLMRDSKSALPHTFTSPLWGMTECGGVTTCPFDAPEEKLFSTDGLPCESMQLKVVDEAGEEVPRGTDGELRASGPMVTKGYFNQPDLTTEHFLEDGFFRTGDQARMDDDGYIRITGRIKDLIIRGGVNISPVDIESVLFAHPKVANVAVIGMPDPRLGERICAYVTPSGNEMLTLPEVQEWMEASQVAKPKWPERIEVIESLPMTPSGKVQKFRLREMIAAQITGKA